MVSLGLAVVLAGPMSHALGGAEQGLQAVASRRVVVAPGETLWSIARRSYPREDPRLVIARIVGANRVEAAGIVPGQVLAIPGPPQG